MLILLLVFLIILVLIGVIKMSAFHDAVVALTAAVGDNTAATDAAVAAFQAGGAPTDAEVAAITTATDTVVANSTRLRAALSPAA